MKSQLSIIIPAYNEEERIGPTLESYGEFFEDLKKRNGLDYEILVVINKTTDNTEEIVKKYQKKYPDIQCLNFKPGGKGFAITEGFKDAFTRNNSLIGFVDADMSTKPEDFYDLVGRIKNYDGIIGNRWMHSSNPKRDLGKLIRSKGFNLLVRGLLFLPYNDTQCGAKVFKREALEDIIDEIGTTQWAFDIDLLYRLKKNGYKVKEVPTIWEDKEGSKILSVKVPIKMAASVIRLRLLYSPLRFIVRLYDKLPEHRKIHSW